MVFIPWSVHLSWPLSPAAVAPCWCFHVWMLHAVAWCHSAEKVKQHSVTQLHRGDNLQLQNPIWKNVVMATAANAMVASFLSSDGAPRKLWFFYTCCIQHVVTFEHRVIFYRTMESECWRKMVKYPPLEENNLLSCTIFRSFVGVKVLYFFIKNKK